LTVTPELGHFISFEAEFTIPVNVYGKSTDSVEDTAAERQKRKWFDYLKPWRWF